jgi:enterochelin esterase family protein
LVEEAGRVPGKIFMSTGLIHDTEDAVRKMGQILDRKGVIHTIKAVNQGHSWGNWRDLADDMLIYLFPVSD